MPRKEDLREVDQIAAEAGLSPEERRDFGRFLERCKQDGDGGTKNDRGDFTRGDFTREELREKVREFLERLR